MALVFGAPVTPAAAGERLIATPQLASGAQRRVQAQRARRRCRSTRCQAAPYMPVDRLPLSSYEFPALPSSRTRPTLLEEAVREAVLHLDQAPFLQLQTGGRTVRHSVEDGAMLDEPQLWQGIGRHLAARGVGQVMLLHPLEPPAAGQPAQCVPGSGEVLSGMGITSASRQSALLSFAELVRAGAAPADFSGRVGDCCDGEPHSEVVAFTRRRHGHSHLRGRHTQGQEQGEQLSPARYWGVILQSRDCARSGGCFVLKTSASRVDDCTCIHWSLTRVRGGAPLFDQLSSAWLLPH